MVSVDFFIVPTIRFQILYVFLVLAHERRRILHFAVTAHPTAEWTAQQMREAFPWDSVPRYLLRDRDRIFGYDFVRQVKAMGIKQVLSAPRSPWQRAYVERVIGTIRRECLDHLSCSTNAACTGTSRHSWTIIIGAGFTWRWRKILRRRDQSSRRIVAASCRYLCWAGFITDTSGAPHESRTSDTDSVEDESSYVTPILARDRITRGSTCPGMIFPGKRQSNPT
jgi:transposase InsO family protein